MAIPDTHAVLPGIVHCKWYFCGSGALPTQGPNSMTSPHRATCPPPPSKRLLSPALCRENRGAEGRDAFFQGHAQGLR